MEKDGAYEIIKRLEARGLSKILLRLMVEHWEDYEHSSARFYVRNRLDSFVPAHYEELS